MTKAEMIKTKVRQDIWAILKKTYGIGTIEPESDKQKEFLDGAAEYVFSLVDNLGAKDAVCKDDLGAALDKVRPV